MSVVGSFSSDFLRAVISIRQSRIESPVKHPGWSSSVNIAKELDTLTIFAKKAPPQMNWRLNCSFFFVYVVIYYLVWSKESYVSVAKWQRSSYWRCGYFHIKTNCSLPGGGWIYYYHHASLILLWLHRVWLTTNVVLSRDYRRKLEESVRQGKCFSKKWSFTLCYIK